MAEAERGEQHPAVARRYNADATAAVWLAAGYTTPTGMARPDAGGSVLRR